MKYKHDCATTHNQVTCATPAWYSNTLLDVGRANTAGYNLVETPDVDPVQPSACIVFVSI